MRKKVLSFFLIISVFLTLFPSIPASAAPSSGLTIYAMYLGNEEKGDSTLLESNGEYLLIDIGAAKSIPNIIKQLQDLEVTHVDIIFSHLHTDHIGGSVGHYTYGLQQITAAGIQIDTLYLPDPSLAPLSIYNPTRYLQINSYMSSLPFSKVEYLTVGDHITVGDTDGQIIGPLRTNELSPSMYAHLNSAAYPTEMHMRYENNCSLVTIFTCGQTRFFTAGDCYDDQARFLTAAYGDSLRCDILKLSHHGIGGGNSTALMKAVQPSFSFVPNCGISQYNSKGQWRTYTSSKKAAKYGMVYQIGIEKETIIYDIADDDISLYKGTYVNLDTKMTGWQKLYGADGLNRSHDMYYLDSTCTPLTGIQKIGKHSYCFQSGGQMDYGSYDRFGEYQGWKTYSSGTRYYKLSSDEKYAYMSTGFTQIEGDEYYFNSKGIQLENKTEQTILKKISSNYYALMADSSILRSEWEIFEDGDRYFDKNGKMLKNCVRKIGKYYYMFDADGINVVSKSGVKLVKLGSKTYAVRTDGSLVTNKLAKINGKKYYFNKSGVMQKDKKIKVKGKTYYCNAKGVATRRKK